MKTSVLMVGAVVLATLLTGCKLVKKGADARSGAAASEEASGDARIAKLVESTWSARLVPHVRSSAVEARDLIAAVASGLDQAGHASGHRSAGDDGAWNFAVKGQGRVVAADRASRAAHIDLDIDGDGTADVVIQLGPVVKGSALRDLAPFYNFTDFRDQIEFARLGRTLNDTAVKALSLPQGDLVGRMVIFTGATAIRSPADTILVVPVGLDVAP